LNSLITPDLAGQAASLLGLDPATLDSALKAVPATVVTALARKAATPEGAKTLMMQLEANDLSALKDPLAALSGMSPEAGLEALSGLLDGQAAGVVHSLARETGFAGFGKLLSGVTPIAIAAIARFARENGLTSKKLAETLQTESAGIAAAAATDRGQWSVVSAFAQADEQVELKKNFSAEEWRDVASAPVLAGVYTAMASKEATEREMRALADALDPAQAPADDGLLTAALLDVREGVERAFAGGGLPLNGLDGVNLKDAATVRDAALAHFRRVNLALRDTPTEEAARFKEAVLLVAQKVAEAQAEGGFLGIGARDVSAGEVRALKDIAGAFGYDVSDGSDFTQRLIISVPGGQYRQF
jgi:hypothetical protein